MNIEDIRFPKFHIVSYYNGTVQHEIATGGTKVRGLYSHMTMTTCACATLA